MFIKLVITLTLAAFCSAAAAKDFYVSPSGSDSLNGLSPSVNLWTKTGPFKTLTRARNAIRQLKATGKFNEAITVHVGKGTYQLQSALELDDRDSGLPGQEITWQGEKGFSIVSGGIALKSCQKYDPANPDQILTCPIDPNIIANIKAEANERISGNAPAFEVFVNERRMQLARWPNSDWAHIKIPSEGKKFSAFEKIPQFLGDLSDAQIHAFAGDDTFDQYHAVSSIDLARNQINLASQTNLRLVSGRRFYLRNIRAALDAPGEWFYDKTNGKILLISPEGESPNNIVISAATNLITANKVSHISFTNLTFRHSTSHAILIRASDSILLDNLEINNIGGRAITANNQNITVSNNHIYDTALGGILVSGGIRETLEPSGNLIENNYIHDYDTILFTQSPAIHVSAGVAATVSHNLIRNGSGNAILLSGNDHLIEKNEISQVCQQASDCGVIYSGRNWTYRGNSIRYNYLHDVSGYQLNMATLNIANNVVEYVRNGARGIYMDDAASGFTVFGNILDNVGQMSLQIGGGRDNKIENNIIKTSKQAILVDNRGSYFDWAVARNSLTTMPISSEIWRTRYPELVAPMQHDTWPENNTIRSNVLISTQTVNSSIFLRYYLPMQSSHVSNNLVWRTDSNILKVDYTVLDIGANKGGALWGTWISQGLETNSLFADPCLNIEGGAVTVTCADSPIYIIGFKAIPSDIGLIK